MPVDLMRRSWNTRKSRRGKTMSNIGFFGSMYEELRTYADKLDRALVGLRSLETATKASEEVAMILHEIVSKETRNPTVRFVSFALKKDLQSRSGQGLSRYELLAKQLGKRTPTQTEIE